MKKLLFLFLILPTIVYADFLVGVGYSHFRQAPNGNWYQKEYSHDLNMNSPSATIRYDFDKYSIGYIYTGKVTSNALAKSSDKAYDAGTEWPLSQFYGTGKSEGIFATRRFGGQYYFTAGLMAYRSTWDVYVPDYRDSTDYPANLKFGPSKPVRLNHKPSWMVLPLAGVGYRTGKYSLELNLIPTKTYGDEYPAIYRGYATNLTLLRHF